MKNIVIAGSAKLQDKIMYWKKYFEENGYNVLDYPVGIPSETFINEFPKVHKHFFENIIQTDILFVMNEEKNGISGYIGAESYAELAFAVAQNLIYDKKIEIIVLNIPSEKVASYEEIILFEKLNWIKICKNGEFGLN
jgi:regulatory protein YycH of two-component signal transduction system YycFG